MTAPVTLSTSDARRLLATYHFTPTDLPGVVDRLGTIQYDPLSPAGRNPDLVLQARVPGYRVDDWQQAAYTNRLLYDAWDKQACLVPTSDWPLRALVNDRYQPYHDRAILAEAPDATAAILDALDRRGPLSSLEFEDRSTHPDGQGSWYGTTTTKRILRALWAEGRIVTHHRKAGRHYYDRAERVIPADYYHTPPLLEEDAFHHWIVARRYQAAGLLRPGGDPAIWSICGDKATRTAAVATGVATGTLTPVKVDGTLYHACTSTLAWLDRLLPDPRLIFIAPLDSLLWDREGVRRLFGFDYIWEVYKPEAQRRWGYYVLPAFYGTRFVGRLDSRLSDGVWQIYRWWWEADVQPEADLLAALHTAAAGFLAYLGARGLRLPADCDPAVRTALADLAA